MSDTARRFFISYAGADRPWAEWVAWQLEQCGHRVILDVWDWRTGDNFVRRMDEALERADAVVALFSKAYFEDERWTGEEWSNAVARQDRVIPLAVEPLANADVRPLLASRIRKDLHGLQENAAIMALHEAVDGGERPTEAPPLPGSESADRPRLPLPGNTGQPRVWNVRPRNHDFSGRETQIADLRDGLLGGRHSVVQALHGMGGIGKTQLALEYAHRFAGQYDLVWWVDAEQSDQIPVHYTELADRLGIAVKEAGAEHNARTLLTELSSRPRWLIILDNAEDPDQVGRWLPDGSGHVLITSRNPNWRRLARPTALDVFTRADSLAYFRTRVTGIPEEQADTLADALGDLPLALAQAAGVIENGTPVDIYLRLLRENTSRILGEGDVPDYSAPLAAAVDIATEGLDEKHPDAAALLRLAAFLGPEPIPIEWLVKARPRLVTIPGDSDDLMWTQSALKPLRRYGLARVDGSAFQIHRLVQAVLRDHVDPAQAESIHDDAAAVLTAVAPGNPQDPADWPTWASLTSHLVSRNMDVAHRPELRPTLRDAVHFLIRGAQPQAAAELAASLREAWIAQLGSDHPDVLTCTQYLGHATSDLGDIRGAWPIIEDAFTRRRRTLGEDHPDTLRSANDLAVILGSLGEEAVSLSMSRDTLARRRRVLGADHPDTLQSASNLAASLSERGEFVAAREMDEDTLARRRRVLGDGHPETLQSALNLAENLRAVGEVTEAHRLHEDTQARCRSTLGDNHPLTLTAVEYLAVTLMERGRLDEARVMFEDSLARRRRAYGHDHPETMRATQGLTGILYELHEYEEVRRLLVDVTAWRRSVLGQDHPITLASAQGLAAALYGLGAYAEARHLFEDTLDRRRRVLGAEHSDTVATTHNLGATLCKLRLFREAVPLLEGAYASRRRTFGGDHPETHATAHFLAEAYENIGKRRQAQKLTSKKGTKRGYGKKTR